MELGAYTREIEGKKGQGKEEQKHSSKRGRWWGREKTTTWALFSCSKQRMNNPTWCCSVTLRLWWWSLCCWPFWVDGSSDSGPWWCPKLQYLSVFTMSGWKRERENLWKVVQKGCTTRTGKMCKAKTLFTQRVFASI